MKRVLTSAWFTSTNSVKTFPIEYYNKNIKKGEDLHYHYSGTTCENMKD